MFDDFDLDSLLIDGVDDNSSASLESASFDTDSGVLYIPLSKP